MTVGRICTREVDFAEAGESVVIAAQRMHARKVGTLAVLDENKRPIGIITDRDLTVRVIAAGADPFATKVRDVMTACPKTVQEDTPLEDALAIMRSGPYRRVLVVDKRGLLLGLLSLDDVLSLLVQEFKEIGELLDRENPASLTAE
jgi:CBS domain-containing protein